MDLRKIKKLLELIEGSSITELKIKEGESSVFLSRQNRPTNQVATDMATGTLPQNQFIVRSEPAPTPTDEPQRGREITSPMVGTYFSSPKPNEKPYVSVGSRVKVGDVLCIIEAMKIFNTIESDIAGVVLEVKKQMSDPVEYGEVLFVIDPE